MADGRVEVARDTRAELRLSAADLRFCAVLSETVVERADGDDAAEAEASQHLGLTGVAVVLHLAGVWEALYMQACIWG